MGCSAAPAICGRWQIQNSPPSQTGRRGPAGRSARGRPRAGGAPEAQRPERGLLRRAPRRRHGQGTRRPGAPSLGRTVGHREQGCLTAEVAERHFARVPSSAYSSRVAPQHSRVSMATHRALDGVLRGPNRMRCETTGLRTHAYKKDGRQGASRGSIICNFVVVVYQIALHQDCISLHTHSQSESLESVTLSMIRLYPNCW